MEISKKRLMHINGVVNKVRKEKVNLSYYVEREIAGKKYQFFTDSFFAVLLSEDSYLPLEKLPSNLTFPDTYFFTRYIEQELSYKELDFNNLEYVKIDDKFETIKFLNEDNKAVYIQKKFFNNMIKFLGLNKRSKVEYAIIKKMILFKHNEDYCFIISLRTQ